MGLKKTHTHTQVVEDNGDELAERVGTRCGQRGSLPQEQRETLCSLEAGHDQVGPVVPREVEGMSAADGCTPSLGGVETPGALEVARVPRVNVPVCVFTNVAKCVLQRTHRAGERRCVRGATSVSAPTGVRETLCATPSASETPCASGVLTSGPACVLPGTPFVKGAPQVGETTCAQETARVCEPPRVSETAG